jgi:hypothetical protein
LRSTENYKGELTGIVEPNSFNIEFKPPEAELPIGKSSSLLISANACDGSISKQLKLVNP